MYHRVIVDFRRMRSRSGGQTDGGSISGQAGDLSAKRSQPDLGMGAPGAAGFLLAKPGGRRADRHGAGDERDRPSICRTGCPSAALLAQIFLLALDGLQHLPPPSSVRACRRRSGGAARGPARTAEAEASPSAGAIDSPLRLQVGRKGGFHRKVKPTQSAMTPQRAKDAGCVPSSIPMARPCGRRFDSAAIQDRDGAALVFDRIRQRFNWLETVMRPTAATTPARSNTPSPRSRRCGWRSSNVPTNSRGSASSCRAAAGRRTGTSSWFGRNLRPAKDARAALSDTLAAFITLACINLAVRAARQDIDLHVQALSRCAVSSKSWIGMAVFERSSGGVGATQAGRQFLRGAQFILEQVEAFGGETSEHGPRRGRQACGRLLHVAGRG